MRGLNMTEETENTTTEEETNTEEETQELSDDLGFNCFGPYSEPVVLKVPLDCVVRSLMLTKWADTDISPVYALAKNGVPTELTASLDSEGNTVSDFEGEISFSKDDDMSVVNMADLEGEITARICVHFNRASN
jgi:hypothetical protein